MHAEAGARWPRVTHHERSSDCSWSMHHQCVGMTMHELPVRLCSAPEDPRHAQ